MPTERNLVLKPQKIIRERTFSVCTDAISAAWKICENLSAFSKMCVGGTANPHNRSYGFPGYGRQIHRVATHKYIIGNMP